MNVSAPNPDVIHVWRTLVSATRVSALYELLTEDERARASRFVFPKDRDQFIAARGSIRVLLGAYLSCAPNEVRFAYGTQGKPTIAAPITPALDLRFNVSHAGDVVVCACAAGRDVGIDVEVVSGRIDPVELGRACFSEEEQRVVRERHDSERLTTFFRYWTAKEAYIKLAGGGLSIPLEDFTIDCRDGTTAWRVIATPELRAGVVVCPVEVPDGYLAAVASDGNGWRAEVRDLGH